MDDQNLKDKQRELADDQMIEQAFKEVLDIYVASRHRKKVDIITKAFNFARQAHKGVRRLSGEPYIMHPIAVARIAVEEMGLGSTSICAALLHDVVEDTDYTVEDISNIFGEKIAQIVDGLTKISGGIFGDKASAQAENFKKLLLTMSDDIRVILIKICDRLHNMRTLQSQPANKQYKIAGETLYIYAPLANRLGLNKIKTELEDLSFRYEHPEEYDYIKGKLADTQAQRDVLFENFTAPIRAALDKMGIKYDLKARVKSPYSIWNKMQNKHVTFDEIYDILAVRIIYTPKERSEEINECFKIYVAISAQTSVGSVRTRLKNRRTRNTTTRFVTILLAAAMANGTAGTAPINEPRKDILIVSHSGCQIFPKYAVLGGNMALRMSKNLLPFFTRTEKLKPVTRTDTAVSSTRIKITSGARLHFSSTTVPSESV